jgi:hypothetical protein
MRLILSPSYGVGSRCEKREEELKMEFERALEDGARKKRDKVVS